MKTTEELFSILSRVNRSAKFTVEGKTKAFFPSIDIAGLGRLALPLCLEQAEKLKGLCHTAPYGKGAETLVNTDVRKCWELDSDQLSFATNDWQNYINKILVGAVKEFDLADSELSAEFYKLLLYEEGGFFLPHQDGEKIDNMIATLIVALPSEHEGGQLIISHADQEKVIDFSDDQNLSLFQHALFYADCQHEIKPVLSGHRLCLIYNVAVKGEGAFNASPNFSAEVDELAKIFELQKSAQAYFAIQLNHQYSNRNFSIQTLKGRDRSWAETIKSTAESLGLCAQLAIIERYECYNAEDEDEVHFEDLVDEDEKLVCIQEFDGRESALRDLSISEEVIFQQGKYNAEKAIDEDYEGFTGNAGMTQSYWYRHAAVLIFPKEKTFDLYLSESTDAATEELYRMCLISDFDRELALKNAQKLQSKIVEDQGHWGSYLRKNDELFDILIRLSDSDLYQRFFEEIYPKSLFSLNHSQVETLSCKVGFKKFCELFSMVIQKEKKAVTYLIDILFLASEMDCFEDESAQLLLAKLVDSFASFRASTYEPNDKPVEQLHKLFKLCLMTDSVALLKELQTGLAKNVKIYPVQSVQLELYSDLLKTELFVESSEKAKQEIKKKLAINKQSFSQEIEQLPERAYVERVPEDLCDCDDCAKLFSFMKSTKETYDIRIVKPRRLHVEEQIALHDVDIITTLDTRPRPQSLLCEKKGAKQRKAIKRFEKYMKLDADYQKLIETF